MVGSERWKFGWFCQGWLKSCISLRLTWLNPKNKTHDARGKSLSVDRALFRGPFQPWKLHPRRGVAKPWAKQQGRKAKSNVPNPIGSPVWAVWGMDLNTSQTFTSVIGDVFLLVLYHIKCHDISCLSKKLPTQIHKKNYQNLVVWWSPAVGWQGQTTSHSNAKIVAVLQWFSRWKCFNPPPAGTFVPCDYELQRFGKPPRGSSILKSN